METHVNTGTINKYAPSRFSIAPMLDLTDRHCRFFHRLLTSQTLLYTEMVTTGAIIYGKGDYLSYNREEHPVVLQLGGSDPLDLATCAKIAQERGYDEINLNVGCPSDRVQNGMFGACLMGHADLVANCVAAMKEVVDIPVTVKTRIGIDEQDSYDFLYDFLQTISEKGGCRDVTIHARKAWLKGLSPKENRDVPPLDYERAYQVKRDFPHLNVGINGGIKTLDEALEHLKYVDGVMMGREAYQNPYLLSQVDQRIFGLDIPVKTRQEVMKEMCEYIERQLSLGVYLGHMTKHLLGLFQGMPGARAWRRYISENAYKQGAGVEVVESALEKIIAKD